jgi:uncharacterized protein GlcG (DUF336 family)
MKTSQTLESITLEASVKIAQTALAHGRQANMAPLAVAVLDVRGVLKAYLAEDGVSLYRFEIAQAKARGVLGLGFGSRELERRAAAVPLFFNAVQALSEGNFVPVRGGVLIRNAQGSLLGAVGISGDTSVNDELCAIAGIKAVALVADCGDPLS